MRAVTRRAAGRPPPACCFCAARRAPQPTGATLLPSLHPARLPPPRPATPAAPPPRSEEGVLALWRGWLPSVIGVVPYVGLNFGVYETLKDVIIRMYGAWVRGRAVRYAVRRAVM